MNLRHAKNLLGFLPLVVWSTMGTPVVAQPSDSAQGNASHPSPYLQQLKGLDKNGNGRIELNEVPARSQEQWKQALSQNGQSAESGVTFDEAAKILASSETTGRRRGGGNGNRDRRNGNGNRASVGNNSDNKAEGKSTTSSPATTSGVPGFGATDNHPPVPGFGVSVAEGENKSEKTSSGETQKTNNAQNHSLGEGEGNRSDRNPERLRQWAQGMLSRFDTNKDGVLDKSEWSKMPNNPEQADTDHDGKITVDELSARLASFGDQRGEGWRSGRGRRGPEGRGGDENGGNGGNGERRGPPPQPLTPQPSANENEANIAKPAAANAPAAVSISTGKKIRMRTPLERLPDGLPSWFLRGDQDGDGQVSMSEFAATWTDTEVKRFDETDKNHDGLISPLEAMQSNFKK